MTRRTLLPYDESRWDPPVEYVFGWELDVGTQPKTASTCPHCGRPMRLVTSYLGWEWYGCHCQAEALQQGRRIIEEDREFLEALAAYDRGERRSDDTVNVQAKFVRPSMVFARALRTGDWRRG